MCPHTRNWAHTLFHDTQVGVLAVMLICFISLRYIYGTTIYPTSCISYKHPSLITEPAEFILIHGWRSRRLDLGAMASVAGKNVVGTCALRSSYRMPRVVITAPTASSRLIPRPHFLFPQPDRPVMVTLLYSVQALLHVLGMEHAINYRAYT